MPKNKKKFISKKNAITFQLVHRSQQDPLAADESAPQHVLVPHSSKKNKDEEHKYGIFFDDGYDYMQHMRDSNETTVHWDKVDYRSKTKPSKKPGVQLPSSVFASEIEEPVGLLNKAAPIHGPRPELDPDIVAALDDDFNYDDPDNVLEDNFIELANQENSDDEYETEEEYEDEADDDVGSLENEMDFGEVETKSRFTDYSMTSSVIRRNEHLTLLDNRFEEMFKGYEENEIGALDCEEIEGTMSTQDEMLLRLAQDTAKQEGTEEAILKEKIFTAVVEDSSSEEEMENFAVDTRKEKWDCESILSTYSNLYNHPAKIQEPKGPPKIRISKKSGIPLDELGRNGTKLTAHTLSLLDAENGTSGPTSVISHISELSFRPKDETLEDKKTRKSNLKMYRRERRTERKANTMAFKEEKERQEKVLLNLKNNLQGIKII